MHLQSAKHHTPGNAGNLFRQVDCGDRSICLRAGIWLYSSRSMTDAAECQSTPQSRGTSFSGVLSTGNTQSPNKTAKHGNNKQSVGMYKSTNTSSRLDIYAKILCCTPVKKTEQAKANKREAFKRETRRNKPKTKERDINKNNKLHSTAAHHQSPFSPSNRPPIKVEKLCTVVKLQRVDDVDHDLDALGRVHEAPPLCHLGDAPAGAQGHARDALVLELARQRHRRHVERGLGGAVRQAGPRPVAGPVLGQGRHLGRHVDHERRAVAARQVSAALQVREEGPRGQERAHAVDAEARHELVGRRLEGWAVELADGWFGLTF